ncbi:MAG TPA: ABC transporter permease [Pseudobdellovibrionaceae bacterium]|nr:ABC transporter permease [Pseudobdellovibrionaceae bacterium]
MFTYTLRRLLSALPVLLGVSALSFSLLAFVPGDPVDIMLGDQAATADKDALRRELGLDRPFGERLAGFYSGLSRLDLGRSLQSRRPVSEEILERVPATIELTLGAMFLALSIGIPFGVLAAVRRHSWVEKAALAYGLVGMSTPGFWLGPMLILGFAIQLDWLPVSERGGLEHLVLPSLTLALGLSAILTQVTRASMIEVVREDYVNVARAKGLRPFKIWFKHALANAMMPIITIIGLQFGALLTGTVIVETIFDWPGVGTLLFQAIQQRNYPLVQGCVLLIATTYVVVNLITDLAYAAANPKVRLG